MNQKEKTFNQKGWNDGHGQGPGSRMTRPTHLTVAKKEKKKDLGGTKEEKLGGGERGVVEDGGTAKFKDKERKKKRPNWGRQRTKDELKRSTRERKATKTATDRL